MYYVSISKNTKEAKILPVVTKTHMKSFLIASLLGVEL